MPPIIPRATYRLQLTADFDFDRAAGIVPYLLQLGITHLYASPFLKARPGSTHGYDITDHSMLNPEFGGEVAFGRFCEALATADMGLILDFVPNHMGVAHADNRWWLDVLEWGRKSPYAPMFDIAWDTLPHRSQGGVLLPILGKPYGQVLEDGEISLRFDSEEGSFAFWYYEHRLPVRPDRYSEILRSSVAASAGEETVVVKELLALANRYGNPGEPNYLRGPELKAALRNLVEAHSVLEVGTAAYSSNHVVLHRLLERQHYRLAHWRVAISEINYRRFFDVNDLAGIRVEDSNTFRLVHQKIATLIRSGQLHGLRLDHIDGLYDPAQYCLRLQKLVQRARARKDQSPFYIVVEKILGPDEALPDLPGVAGTTGYDILNQISRVLVKDTGLSVLEDAWQTAASPGRNYAQIVDETKRQIIETSLASEFTVLVRLLSRIAAGHWLSRDFTEDRLREALKLFVLEFPVYRTYMAHGVVTESDRKLIESTVSETRQQWVGSDVEILSFLKDVLTLDLLTPERTGYSATRVQRFVGKFQQFTGPVTAKAIEDTAFYRYHRLLALNEVGNDPTLPGLSVEKFHQIMVKRAANTPHAMTATATHDTKRGEDGRMRLLALSEIAEDWSIEVRHWREMNDHICKSGKQRSPSRAHEYMLYQALLGTWEIGSANAELVDRLKAYAVKAAREGKHETSWTNPNDAYEQGLGFFIEALLDPKESTTFLDSFRIFVARVDRLGACNGFAQLVLKCMLPGVPDFYQGTEFADLSLVDPDNRRPVDFGARQLALRSYQKTDNGTEIHFGSRKLALTKRLLEIREGYPELFANGAYQPVEVGGRDEDHVIAFARVLNNRAILVAAVRHFADLTDGGRSVPDFDRFNAEIIPRGFRPIRTLIGEEVTSDRPALALRAPVLVVECDIQ